MFSAVGANHRVSQALIVAQGCLIAYYLVLVIRLKIVGRPRNQVGCISMCLGEVYPETLLLILMMKNDKVPLSFPPAHVRADSRWITRFESKYSRDPNFMLKE